MIDVVLTLISPGESVQNEYGIWQDAEDVRRKVLAKAASVGRREFFAGGEAGLRPEYQFTVFAAEYQGEEICEYLGQAYTIYRTYHVPGSDYLELYAQRRVGVGN